VQSIAVPIEPPPAAAATPAPVAPAADVETINPETLAEPAANEPKPL
jgi:hypothetical protein